MILPSRYELSAPLTAGGMGEIYKCTDTHLNREVILKVLKKGEEARRLLDEQKALLQIRSRHVVQLYDIIEIKEDGNTNQALILEFIDGDTLTPGCQSLDNEYLKTLWQIACGLSAIHASGIIHRDIKPSNIKIDSSGNLKILDFGLSRRHGEDAATVNAIGTPIFMAPELWKKSDVSFDNSIDVYAFAITALALKKDQRIPATLTAYPPGKIEPGELNEYLKGIPSDIIGLLEDCLSHDTQKRPHISEIEKTLNRHLLHNKHRALLVANGATYELNKDSTNVNVKIASLGEISINYDGYQFIVKSQSGQVTANNRNIANGEALPHCCVLTFGTGSSRRFITFDVSNPEVMP
ncbi:serine/threonine-protein kinase [Pseudomonas sp. NY15435]|uniref:serine/threonine-protein kinase n=1 Tax=Pseudomonas sp. NY15435 TaxID=3400358 RepID=UPI003A8C238A